eukprot:gene56241-77093_t
MARKKGKLFRVVFYILSFGAIYLGYDMAFNMGEKYLYSKFVDITENAPGKVVVVTGANSGLGFETARSLAKANAVVVLACRSEKRGKEAVQKILSRGHLSPDKVLYMHLDLASLDSVRAFAVALTEKFKSIDVLVNNA